MAKTNRNFGITEASQAGGVVRVGATSNQSTVGKLLTKTSKGGEAFGFIDPMRNNEGLSAIDQSLAAINRLKEANVTDSVFVTIYDFETMGPLPDWTKGLTKEEIRASGFAPIEIATSILERDKNGIWKKPITSTQKLMPTDEAIAYFNQAIHKFENKIPLDKSETYMLNSFTKYANTPTSYQMSQLTIGTDAVKAEMLTNIREGWDNVIRDAKKNTFNGKIPGQILSSHSDFDPNVAKAFGILFEDGSQQIDSLAMDKFLNPLAALNRKDLRKVHSVEAISGIVTTHRAFDDVGVQGGVVSKMIDGHIDTSGRVNTYGYTSTKTVGDIKVGNHISNLTKKKVKGGGYELIVSTSDNLGKAKQKAYSFKFKTESEMNKFTISNFVSKETKNEALKGVKFNFNSGGSVVIPKSYNAALSVVESMSNREKMDVFTQLKANLKGTFNKSIEDINNGKWISNKAQREAIKLETQKYKTFVNTIDSFSTGKSDMYLKNGILAGLISSKGIEGEDYADLVKSIKPINSVYNNASTANAFTSPVTTQIKDGGALGYAVIEGKKNSQIAIFNNNNYDNVIQKLEHGRALSTKDALMISMPSVSENGEQVFYKNSAKANNKILNENGLLTTVHKEMLGAINEHIGSAQLAEDLSNGNVYRSQQFLNRKMNSIFTSRASTNRYHHAEINKPVANNTIRSKIASGHLDISRVVVGAHKGIRADVKSFTDIYSSEWTDILRDIVSDSDGFKEVYNLKGKDGRREAWSNLGKNDFTRIEGIRNAIQGAGYDLNKISFESFKPSTLIGKGLIAFEDNDPRQFTALEFLSPTKKDSVVRSPYGFRPLDAERTRNALSGTTSYVDRNLYSQAETLTDYYLGNKANTQARGIIIPTVIADDKLIAKLAAKNGISYEEAKMLSNYNGELLVDSKLQNALFSTQDKKYQIDKNLGLDLNLNVGDKIKAGESLAQAKDGSSVGNVMLKGKYGGIVKAVEYNQETGFYDVIMTEYQRSITGGRSVGDSKGSIHYFGFSRFKELGGRVGAIQAIDKVDENEAAKLVRGTIELMTSKIESRKERKRLVELINEQIFNIKDPAKAIATLNDNNHIIFNNTISKEEYKNAFQEGNRGIFGALHDFKAAVGWNTEAVKATIMNIDGEKYDIYGAQLGVGDVDDSWRAIGNRGAVGKGVKIGPRELEGLKESNFFFKYAMGEEASKDADTIYNSFSKVIKKEGIQKTSQEFWYGAKALTEENLISTEGGAHLNKSFNDFIPLTEKARNSADNFDVKRDANVYSFIDSRRTSEEVKDLTHTMKAAQVIDEWKYGYASEGAMNTVIDPKISAKGLYSELPKAVDEGTFKIHGLYLPSSEPQKMNGGLIANKLQSDYDYAFKAATDYSRAAESGNITKDIEDSYLGAVRKYHKTYLSEMSRKDGQLIKQTMSGEMFNTAYLTAQSMNLEVYAKELAEAGGDLDKIAKLENTVYINPKQMEQLLDGHTSSSKYLNGSDDLTGFLHRFPTLGGNSSQASLIKASKYVDEGTMVTSLGMFLSQGGDYDTDKGFLMLNQKNADGSMDAATMAANKRYQNIQAQRSAIFGKYAVEQYKQTSEGLGSIPMEELWSFRQAIAGDEGNKQALIDRFGKEKAAGMQVDFEKYLDEIVQKGGPHADNAKALTFEARAQMQIGSISNLSVKLRTAATAAAEKMGDPTKIAGILETMQILEQVTAISSKHLSSSNITAEAIKANSGLVKSLRDLDGKTLVGFMEETGLFTKEGNFSKEILESTAEADKGGKLIKTFGLDLDYMNNVMDQSGNKMTHKQQILESFDTLRAMGLNQTDLNRKSGKFGYTGIDNLKDFTEAINDFRTPKEAIMPLITSLDNAGADVSKKAELNYFFKLQEEAINIPKGAFSGADDAAIPSMQEIFTRGGGASKTAAAEAFNFAKFKQAAPFVAAGLGLAALAGIATAPNVKKRTQDSIATDGAVSDPAMAQILSESAPIGSGPTGRVNPQQYKKTTVKIKANASGGLTNEDLSGIIEKEIYRQTSIPVSINYTSKDDRQTIDKTWVEDQFIKAINAGKTT